MAVKVPGKHRVTSKFSFVCIRCFLFHEYSQVGIALRHVLFSKHSKCKTTHEKGNSNLIKYLSLSRKSIELMPPHPLPKFLCHQKTYRVYWQYINEILNFFCKHIPKTIVTLISVFYLPLRVLSSPPLRFCLRVFFSPFICC